MTFVIGTSSPPVYITAMPSVFSLSHQPFRPLARIAKGDRGHRQGKVPSHQAVLFKQGDPAKGLFLVEAGKIALSQGRGRSKRMFGIADAGSVLGLPAIVRNQPYSLTAIAVEDTELTFGQPDKSAAAAAIGSAALLQGGAGVEQRSARAAASGITLAKGGETRRGAGDPTAWAGCRASRSERRLELTTRILIHAAAWESPRAEGCCLRGPSVCAADPALGRANLECYIER